MKNFLFITWDGPQTSYMEGLFMPIFHALQKHNPSWKFHVVQFTWGDEKRIQETQKVAESLGIHYQALPISRKPIAALGSFISLFQGAFQLKRYIQEHQIDVLMPRSTFPAYMVSQLKEFKGKIIFDADGLPIEERVDFAGLKRSSLLHKFLKKTETNMLLKADHVITRSQKAIEVHLHTVGEGYRTQFSVVYNGRDKNLFRFDKNLREIYRKEFGLTNEFLFVYAGSLGPQYCLSEMMEIFQQSTENQSAKFLILTGNLEFAQARIPAQLKEQIILKKVAVEDVPKYLNAADMAFALREPSFSMQGVAPIKLGEYLLCGLPVIASKGIGDSESILQEFENCFLYDHAVEKELTLLAIHKFIENSRFVQRTPIAQKAESFFSLEAAAESYLRVLKRI